MATDWLAVHTRAIEAFGAYLSAVVDWTKPTPDVGWNVQRLVEHVIDEQRRVPLLLAGRSAAEMKARLTPLGDDLVGEWQRYSAAASAVWQSVDLEQTVRIASDRMTARDYLAEQASDLIVHSWDLATSIGAQTRLDHSLVEAAWSVFEPQKDALQSSGLYAEPVAVPANASLQTRLLALTGRDEAAAAKELTRP